MPLELTDVISLSCDVLFTILILQKLQPKEHPNEVYKAARGLQLLRSLMPYSPKKITDRQSSIFESAVHLCLEKTKTTLGKNPKFLRVRGNGNNIKPEDWPNGFQRNLRAQLNTEH